jgi:microcystin-dependent protein
MADPFIGEIKIVAFDFAMKGWALCNGQLMGIAQNQALFSILGTTYGGNGVTTFALPDLRGRAPVHAGSNFVGVNPVSLGEVSGQEHQTLLVTEIPMHTHPVIASSATGSNSDPANEFFAQSAELIYKNQPDTILAPQSVGLAGGSQPHNNLQPYLVLNFQIALVGIFPSRN